MSAIHRQRERDTTTLPVVVVELGCGDRAETDMPDVPRGVDARRGRRPLSSFVDPDVTEAFALWHRQFIPPAPPSRPVGFEQPARAGHPEEILVTLRCRPTIAREIAVEGAVFGPRLARLAVAVESLSCDERELSWDVVLRAPIWRRRRSTMRLFASPSANVSILTLTPKRPHRMATNSFIRAGIRALHAVGNRIDIAAEARGALIEHSRSVS